MNIKQFWKAVLAQDEEENILLWMNILLRTVSTLENGTELSNGQKW